MKPILILLLLSMFTHLFSQQSDTTITYEGGELYHSLYNGETNSLKPAGKIDFIVYDTFYKHYVIFFKSPDTPSGGVYKYRFDYVSEKIENGKLIVYMIEFQTKDIYFTTSNTLSEQGSMVFIKQEPVDGILYSLIIKNTIKK